MSRTSTIALLFLVLVMTSSLLWAASPQFNKLSAVPNGPTLNVAFKGTGLGNDPGTVTLADDVTVECFSQGKGGTQQTSATTKVSTTENFTPHNGSYTGSISFTARCPGNQDEGVATFSDVTITLTTSTGSVCEPVTNSAGQICTEAGGTATNCTPC
jgi:hypothetical protein